SFIERFSGDGILVSSPAGSTAYNYSLGGSIVDPNLELLQLTPMAPSNNRTYRSFTSSLILPSYQTLEVIPDPGMDPYLTIIIDGFTYNYRDVENIHMGYSEKKLRMVQFSDYGFWKKVKEKFL
ncbi:MAG: NAD(+)/NADH kinase, partial [Eubacterium sp.]|nr:NAD(+)/NADH kinase [Eubacterium sp.]